MEQAALFSFIDSAIEQIKSVESFLDEKFLQLQGKTQEVVDEIIVNDINPTVNELLNDIRESIINSGKACYNSFVKLQQKIEPVASANPTNLTSVIDFCLAVKDFLVTAYESITQFITKLTLKLAELTSAISSIVAYRPPIVGINFDKLDIKMEPISLSDITGG